MSKQKVAVITGSGQGIGKALAERITGKNILTDGGKVFHSKEINA